MSTQNRFVGCRTGLLLPLRVLILLVLVSLALGLPTSGGEAPPVASPTQYVSSDELLRSYLQLQGQLHSLELSVDQNRQDAAAAAEKSADQMGSRLNSIEQTINAQRARELEAMQSSNRVMLTVAGTFAAVGLLAMVCMAWFQWRTINRLAELSAALPASRLLGPGSAAWASEQRLLTASAGAAEESNARLMGNLERLEKRLLELEHTSKVTPQDIASSGEGSRTATTDAERAGTDSAGTEAQEQSKLSLLLAKGQSLLNLDRPQEALAVFDEALKDSPTHPEALLKRALALERLEQFEEALESCDRAIAADRTSTMAYLQKGGLYNRMERFEDAIHCYEAALSLRP